MDSLEIMFKEYETLRQEIIAAMSNEISILSFGIAAVGVILAASISTHESQSSSLLVGLMLSVLLPSICIFILLMWLGEYQRIQRAGRFLVELERKINAETSREILTWETHLRKQGFYMKYPCNSAHMRYPYNSAVSLLIVISVISQVIGITNMGMPASIMWMLIVAGIIVHSIWYMSVNFLLSRLQE